MKKIVVSTGGTGGHIFPASVLANELEKQNFLVKFIVDERFKKYPSKLKLDKKQILFLPISSPSNKIKFVISLFLSTAKMIKLFFTFKPDLIIGFGGYMTLPVLISGALLRIKLVLYEANSVIGKVNKMFVPLATYIAFGIPSKNIPKNSSAYIGSLVNTKCLPSPYPELNKTFNILILGGSQGASIMTKCVAKVIVEVAKNHTQYLISVSHQSPENEIPLNQATYSNANIEAEVSAFFTDVEEKISNAHLIICRAGAGTINDILTIGRPAIYIPYPNSVNDHQLHNAEFVSNHGAGFIVKQDENLHQSLLTMLTTLVGDVEKLKIAAQNAHNIDNINGTNKMLEIIKNATK